MRHFEIKKGAWPSEGDRLPQMVSDAAPVQAAALLGADVPGLRPRFEVEEGARVDLGQVLFRDRKQPEIAFVAPIAGRVASIDYGPRRTLSACIIEADAEVGAEDVAALPDTDMPREALWERGLWPAFRTRPFGRTPAPDARPVAIFVNAVRAGPGAPDPVLVLAGQEEAFRLGVTLLERLTQGDVFLCQSPGAPLAPETGRVICASFAGSLAAGLAGTHIDRLCPASPGREVWSIGYQDVAAMGHLFQTGRYRPERVVAIGGPAASQPRLVRTILGARIAGVSGSEAGEALSGDALSGRSAAYLGRFDEQITLLPRKAQRAHRPWFARFGAGQGALIPTRALERAMALDIPPVPLLRALLVGDSEAAERLGCLALIEEDVAALTRRCTSGADYARLLRQVLDDLRDGAA